MGLNNTPVIDFSKHTDPLLTGRMVHSSLVSSRENPNPDTDAPSHDLSSSKTSINTNEPKKYGDCLETLKSWLQKNSLVRKTFSQIYFLFLDKNTFILVKNYEYQTIVISDHTQLLTVLNKCQL